MKKIVTAAALALAGVALAAPAHAADDPDLSGAISAADNWNWAVGLTPVAPTVDQAAAGISALTPPLGSAVLPQP
ncbi:hypothetical protein ACIGN6_22750 [Streptomyces sp. NPDC053792]|uniref:hypothetical protein n=1 Tax=unclassified Streptomyces TaxID=2593676 RepID=UPI0034199F8C